MAKYVEDDNKADYQYRSSRFEYGLSPFYKLALMFQGWEQVFHEGEMKVYEKDGRKVSIIHGTADDDIYIHE